MCIKNFESQLTIEKFYPKIILNRDFSIEKKCKEEVMFIISGNPKGPVV